MKVGVGVLVQGGLFDSGVGQTALFVYKGLKAAGADVVLVDLTGTAGGGWWPEATALRTSFRCISAADVGAEALDLYVDIDGITAPALRAQASKRCAALFRGNMAFDCIEQSGYIRPNVA